MSRKYTKEEHLAEIIRAWKAGGETNRENGESLGLSKEQVKQLANRKKRKERLLAAGYIARPKGRPRKEPASEEARRNKEVMQLSMFISTIMTVFH